MYLPVLLIFAALVAGCGSLRAPPPPPAGAGAWAEQSDQPPWKGSGRAAAANAWKHQVLPGKSATLFSFSERDGRQAMAAEADASASLLRRQVRVEPADLAFARFSWRVPQLIAGADMGSRHADDSPVRIVLAFDGDRSRFSQRNAVLSELALTLTGEPLPYATLMYVWCNTRPVGTVITSPRTDRIRKLVVESGPERLDRWLDYRRDIRADFERAFGEPPGALIGVAIMTDTDNTRDRAKAW